MFYPDFDYSLVINAIIYLNFLTIITYLQRLRPSILKSIKQMKNKALNKSSSPDSPNSNKKLEKHLFYINIFYIKYLYGLQI